MPRDPEGTSKKPTNMFAVLADDSESEDSTVETELNEKIESKDVSYTPTFAPDPTPTPAEPVSPPFRVWLKDDNIKFETEVKNIFNSSRQKWSRPRFKEDGEGWVSIRWNQPQFQDFDEENENEQEKEKEQEQETTKEPVNANANAKMPELNLTSTIDSHESIEKISALAWAERIKKSLEKAEQSRASFRPPPKEEFQQALGRLSFFRRPMVEPALESVAKE